MPFIVLLLFASCSRTESYTHTLRVVCDPSESPSRSSFPGGAVGGISDLNLFVYDSGGTLVEEYYQSGSTRVSAVFPDEAAEYDIYAVANVGRLSAPRRESEIERLIYEYDGYGAIAEKGLPMAGELLGCSPLDAGPVMVRCIAARYSVSFDNNSAKAEYVIKDVCLCNVPADIYPFGEGTSARHVLPCGDRLDPDDISSLNRGSSVTLYALENLQGVLLPDNTDPARKTPSDLTAEQSSLCTYLEVTADVLTTTSRFQDVRFRAYLGDDLTTDFNVRRNRSYRLRLDFESDMVVDDGWRVDADPPSVEGSLALSKTVAEVIKGIDDVIYVYTSSANEEEMDIVLSADGEEISAAGLSYVTERTVHEGKPAVAVRFTTSHPIDALNDLVSAPDALKVRFTVSSAEAIQGVPVLSTAFLVNVYHEVFPILLRARTSYLYKDMYAYSNSPFKIPFSGSFECICGQDANGISSEFSNAVPSMEGAFIARYYSYSDKGTRIKLEMEPVIDGRICEMYMGECSTARFGPGDGLSPRNMHSVSDGDNWYKYSDGYPLMDTNEGFSLLFRSSKGAMFLIDKSCSGWNSQNLYSFEKFEGCPYYFINGGLQVIAYYAFDDDPKYLDDSARIGYQVIAYEPGRDLEYGTGSYEIHYTTFGALMGIMKQFWGNTHVWMEWQNYDYYSYLTINGCSCWAGATSGVMGCTYGI